MTGVQTCALPISKEPYGVAINKHQKSFVKAVNQAIDEIKADGEYNRLIKKWFGQVPGFNYKELYSK